MANAKHTSTLQKVQPPRPASDEPALAPNSHISIPAVLNELVRVTDELDAYIGTLQAVVSPILPVGFDSSQPAPSMEMTPEMSPVAGAIGLQIGRISGLNSRLVHITRNLAL